MILQNQILSLEEKVYVELESKILEGELKAGDSLGEVSLSQRLGVSRTPVRGALRRLAEEGLVSAVANKGAVVIGVTERDLVDIYRIRVRLEGLASRMAAEKISQRALLTLSESVDLSDFYIQRGDTDKLKELDSTFHETIYREAGNRLLYKTLAELHRKIRLYRKMSLSVPGRLEASQREHREILDAIAAGDGERADELTSRHIEKALDNLMRALGNSEK